MKITGLEAARYRIPLAEPLTAATHGWRRCPNASCPEGSAGTEPCRV